MRAVLHVVSDRQRSRLPVEQALAQSAAGGADVLQVRQKKQPAAETYALLARLGKIGRDLGTATRLVVNDRMDVAMAAGADGVHLAAKSLPVCVAATVRRASSWSGLIGCSVHALPEALAAMAQGADYVTFGHVFASASHRDLPPRGLEALADIVDALDIPVVAIGGIDGSNLRAVLQTGCSGVAVIGAVMDSDDPRRATENLVDILARASRSPRIPFPVQRGGVYRDATTV